MQIIHIHQEPENRRLRDMPNERPNTCSQYGTVH